MGRKTTSGLREAIGPDEAEPSILCPICRRLTPVAAERCTTCGARISRTSSSPRAPKAPALEPVQDDEELEEARRSLVQLFEDLQRVYDVSSDPVRAAAPEESPLLFQCPVCGRFVAEDAATCACGARFASEEARLEYACPRCGALVAPDAESCRCGVRFSD